MFSWRDLKKGKRELNDIYTAILLIMTFLNRPFLQYAFFAFDGLRNSPP